MVTEIGMQATGFVWDYIEPKSKVRKFYHQPTQNSISMT